jgi:hypothetical protein
MTSKSHGHITMQWDPTEKWTNPHYPPYWTHRSNAQKRGIPFELSFKQWCVLWNESGKWEKRGTRSEQYCMARRGDKGAYEIRNVIICRNRDNRAERNRNYPMRGADNPAFGKDYWATATKAEKKRRAALISAVHKGKEKSLQTRTRMSETARGRKRVIRNGHAAWAHPEDKDFPRMGLD